MNKRVLEIMADTGSDGDARASALVALAVLYANGGTMVLSALYAELDRLWMRVSDQLEAVRYLERHGHAERKMRGDILCVWVTP